MIPALYVAFMTRFGQSVGSSAYTDFGIVSYGLGLVLSTLVMIMTRTIQPALFYTAPAMIVATFFIAMKRNERNQMMAGWDKRTIEPEAPINHPEVDSFKLL